MADTSLDILRRDALTKRLKNIGGNNILWSAKDAALITDRIMTMPAEMMRRDVPVTSRKLIDAKAVARRQVSEQGIAVCDIQPGDLDFLFVISSEAVDRSGDVITAAGVDYADFVKNPAVLNAHDSSTLPIAISTPPKISGASLTAIAQFPQLGVNECSDQVAAAIRSGLVRAQVLVLFRLNGLSRKTHRGRSESTLKKSNFLNGLWSPYQPTPRLCYSARSRANRRGARHLETRPSMMSATRIQVTGNATGPIRCRWIFPTTTMTRPLRGRHCLRNVPLATAPF